MERINIIGAGLAGCECAYILSKYNIKCRLYEMKPTKKSPAHMSNDFAELVCSNSLKSELLTNACGLLKEEMRMLGSLFVEAAYNSKVPAGNALAVNREEFSKYITERIKNNPNIEIVYEEVEDLSKLEGTTVIATGPLTSEALSSSIAKLIGENKLYFYDAAAPIVTRDSIDMTKAYRKDRYGEIGSGDYLNLAMTKEEYDVFYEALLNSETADRHSFDTIEALEEMQHFEGCMPIEAMAQRGEKTLVFGPLKPVGLYKEDGTKPYAVLQLRKEDKSETMYNLVGFQTSLKFAEQKRVFGLIPGLENAEFIRYGVMHRNTYINAPKILNSDFSMKDKPNIYFAGQISGVEGYVESAASGLMVAYNILARLNGTKIDFPEETMLGALSKYIATENEDYQPMNANFGIIKGSEKKIRDKKERYSFYATRSMEKMKELTNELKKIR